MAYNRILVPVFPREAKWIVGNKQDIAQFPELHAAQGVDQLKSIIDKLDWESYFISKK